MRTRLIGIIVVVALVLGGALLLVNAGGTDGGTTTSVPQPSTNADPTVLPTTTTAPPPPTTTAAEPTTSAAVATTAPEAALPVGCFFIDDARGVLLVLGADGEEREVGPILDAATGEPPRGGGPDAASQLEALAHQPGTTRYFATSWGMLGTVDTATAQFSRVGDTGSRDVDGLAFDAAGTLYGVTRVIGAPDTLVVIDPETGRTEAVGPITGPGALEDVDDLAVEPGSGTLYGLSNHEGEVERTSVLVTIDPADGGAAAVGTDLGVTDAEGLTFQSDGRLWVTTGRRGGSALFEADPATGIAEGVAVLAGGTGDYEAMACPNGGG